jgi:predicted nucleic acid-binding protein
VADRDSVLVDSSVWIGFFGGDARAIGALTALKDAHRIVICGQIKQEVLQGSRDAKALARVEREMAIWDYEAEQPADFVVAAGMYANLRWKGLTIPAADCLIAAVAKRCDMRVCAIDPHFERIPGVRLYAAGSK